MLTVTLYKNCILNDSYSEVFDQVNIFKEQKTAHEYYLSKLNGLVINCGETYVTNSGSINFDLKPSETQYIYEYNYMKLHDSNLPDEIADRYAFIDNITIVNTIAVVNYSEDIWANYSKKMNLRMGYLSRSYLLNYPLKDNTNFNIPFYHLPLNYKSNNKPLISQIFPEENHFWYVVVFIQLYKTDSAGNPTERYCYTALLGEEPYFMTSIDDITKIVTATSFDTVTRNDAFGGGGEFNYDITRILVVPAEFAQEQPSMASSSYKIGSFKKNSKFTLFDAVKIFKNDLDFSMGKNYVIENDFKTIGIGPINNIQEIDMNGSPIELKITITCTSTTFDILMIYQNKVINITQSFAYDVPIGVDSRESTQLKAMQRELQNSSYDSQQVNNGIGILQNVLGFFGGGIKQLLSFMDPETANAEGASQMIDSTAGLARGINSTVMTEKQRNLTNAKLFTTNKSMPINTKNAHQVAWYGLVKTTIDSDNDQEVENQIKETGYLVEETLNFDIFQQYKPDINTKYNVMKFDDLRMNGAFPQDIKTKLENILLSGFKIYYGI